MFDLQTARKDRGAFYTPRTLAKFIVNWAIRRPDDSVLEPACGEAVFLVEASARFSALDPTGCRNANLVGVENHPSSAAKARHVIAAEGVQATVLEEDFFDLEPRPEFDAVIGNPPYVRFQSFSGAARAKAKRTALEQGVSLTNLASSWAAFVVHATSFLRPAGRIGLVLPAELLSVNYAASVRRFLLQRFKSVRLILFDSLVFEDAQEEIVVLLAEGVGPTDHFEVFQAGGIGQLADLTGRQFTPVKLDAKWIPALLPDKAMDAYQSVARSQQFVTLKAWGGVDLGAVTGENSYFTLSPEQVRAHGLSARDVIRISPPSSRHLKGLEFSDAAWEDLFDSNARVYLFRPAELSPAAQEYVKSGEIRGVHEGYKCRMRNPWWKVPIVRTPDLFLTYMNHNAVRIVANTARVKHLNSIHGITLHSANRSLGMETLPIATLNSISLLSAELVGRSYGGGVLKLEPKEADELLVPAPEVLESLAGELKAVRPLLAPYLRADQIGDAARLIDDIVLVKHLGFSEIQLELVRSALLALRHRRLNRGVRQK